MKKRKKESEEIMAGRKVTTRPRGLIPRGDPERGAHCVSKSPTTRGQFSRVRRGSHAAVRPEVGVALAWASMRDAD